MYERYWQMIQRRLPYFLLLGLGLAAATFSVAARRGVTFEVHYSHLVSITERERSPDYTFDGYYALQATDLFTATLAGWTGAPEVIVAAYIEAGLPVPDKGARQLRKTVSARQTAPQLVEVTVSADSKKTAERLARGLIAVTDRNVALYHEEGIPALQFSVVTTNPWTAASRPAAAILSGAVFLATVILLINAAILWESVHDAGSG